MTRDDERRPSGSEDNSRILALSDGVFAIAITLLVLDLKIPHREVLGNESVAAAVWEQLPHFAAYVLTFFVIGMFWMAHHRLFTIIRGHDDGLIWLNALFLFCITFLPFPTGVFGEHDKSRFATIFYAASLAGTWLALSLLGLYAARDRRLVHADVADEEVRYIALRGLGIPGVCALVIVLSLVSVTAAQSAFVLMPVYHFALARRFRRARASRPLRTVAE